MSAKVGTAFSNPAILSKITVAESGHWRVALPDRQTRPEGRHVLVISKEQQESFSTLSRETLAELPQMIGRVRQFFQDQFGSGQFLALIRDGKGAGQQVPHCHIHMISVDEEKTDDGDIAKLHNDILASRTVERISQEQHTAEVANLKAAFEKTGSTTPAKTPRAAEISAKTTIATFEHWALVLKSQPASNGHLVAVSKKEYTNLHDVPAAQAVELGEIAGFAKRLFEMQKVPQDMLILQRNGAAAGQRRDHVHMHFIPGQTEVTDASMKVLHDGLTTSRLPASKLSEKDLETSVQAFKEAAKSLQLEDAFKDMKVTVAS